MAWPRPGDKALSEQWWLVYWRIYASLGFIELTVKPKIRLSIDLGYVLASSKQQAII